MGTPEGKYIYCIIAAAGIPEKFPIPGIGGYGDLFPVCQGDLAAVVSDSPVISYRTSRENLMAHEKAIEAMMAGHVVLPVKFGTIADNSEKIRAILENEHDKFKALLNKIDHKKELGLKAIFREDVIYQDILEKHKDITAMKMAIMDLPPEKTYHQRMWIGEMVETALKEEIAICRDYILDTLSPLAFEVRENPAFSEKMVINAAFLVDEKQEAAFDRKVNDIGAKYGDKIKFKYVGGVPPFNFVNLLIRL